MVLLALPRALRGAALKKRVNYLSFLVLVAISLLVRQAVADDPPLWPASRFAQLPDDQVSLLKEYFDTYFSLKDFYQNLTMTAEERVYRIPQVADKLPIPADLDLNSDALSLASIRRFTYRSQKGGFFRLDRQRISPGDETTILDSQTGIIRPDESFLLGYDLEAKRYFLIGHGKDNEEYLTTLRSHVFPFAPVLCDGLFLEDLFFIEESPWKITSVEVVDKNKVKAVLLGSFPRGEVTRTFWFLRNRYWALARVEVDSTQDYRDEGKVLVKAIHERTYQEGSSGFPILTRVTLEGGGRRVGEERRRVTYRNVIEVSGVVPGPADSSVFDTGPLLYLDTPAERDDVPHVTVD